MQRYSLFAHGHYSLDWIKDFYAEAGTWWGPDPQEPGVHPARVQLVERLCGPAPLRLLELGAASGATAACLADAGYDVVALDLTPRDDDFTRQLLAVSRRGSLTYLQADYYAVELPGRFDVICQWEGFGLGTDADQRRLLRRIRHEWLAPGGLLLMDVYSPVRPARDANTEQRLDPLPGVPGSVHMIERCYFDPVSSRWIDEWQPVAGPTANPDDPAREPTSHALAQAIRCYTPADLLLLLEGTGLTLRHVEVDGQAVDFSSSRITTGGALFDAWSYTALLGFEGE